MSLLRSSSGFSDFVAAYLTVLDSRGNFHEKSDEFVITFFCVAYCAGASGSCEPLFGRGVGRDLASLCLRFFADSGDSAVHMRSTSSHVDDAAAFQGDTNIEPNQTIC